MRDNQEISTADKRISSGASSKRYLVPMPQQFDMISTIKTSYTSSRVHEELFIPKIDSSLWLHPPYKNDVVERPYLQLVFVGKGFGGAE